MIPHLPSLLVSRAVEDALVEDLGRAGDLTSDATIPAEATASAVLATREEGILCGIGFAETAFTKLDAGVAFKALKQDGDKIKEGLGGLLGGDKDKGKDNQDNQDNPEEEKSLLKDLNPF